MTASSGIKETHGNPNPDEFMFILSDLIALGTPDLCNELFIVYKVESGDIYPLVVLEYKFEYIAVY